MDRLTDWFTAHRRDLPWRRRRTGYTALVSEAMLQQTQVSRVVPLYEKFVERFPNVRALATADLQEVLAHWQGLGYYRRARSLHAAAQQVVERHGGRVPSDPLLLQELPGVGRYTAGAIASIAFGKSAPIVDGNVQRVIARWNADRRAPADALADTWRRASSLVQLTAEPGVFNEGLMELGALVCTVRTPRCSACPVAEQCMALREGATDSIPPPKASPSRKTIVHHAVIVTQRGRILMEQRPATGLWAELWQVPTVEAVGKLKPEAVGLELARRGIELDSPATAHSSFEHLTTHRRVVFHIHMAKCVDRRASSAARWHWISRLDQLPLGNAQKRVIRAVQGSPA